MQDTKMVEESFFWCLIHIAIIKSWIIFHINYPESKVKSQRDFWLALVRQLVQDLKASPACPNILVGTHGAAGGQFRQTPGWKHFPCKVADRVGAVFVVSTSQQQGKNEHKNHNFLSKAQGVPLLWKLFWTAPYEVTFLMHCLSSLICAHTVDLKQITLNHNVLLYIGYLVHSTSM